MGQTPVAIIGLAGIFPQAASVAEFWDNIYHGRNCITEVPASRWSVADYYDSDPNAPDKTYSRWGGFIPDVPFDPMEFGIPPNVLEVTDVSQLLALGVAKRALEDAGYGEGQAFDRSRTGVILGVGGGQKLITPLTSRLQAPVWEEAMESAGISSDQARSISETIKSAYVPWEENSFPGMLGNVIAGRIANRLDLGGMNCVVDAACASSLAALRLALAELTDGNADMMITGGVDADNSIFMYMCFSKTPAFTANDRIRPFDAGSDGMMLGEGIGLLVLKRLADAERDGDRVYAVIRGLGSSSDGRFKSIYAPRSEGQALALERAYERAGVPLASVGLIEAHGTGTVAGDLVELTTLQNLFEANGAQANQTALGSVKSQIGHTKATAGAAGLIKAALALHHKVIPPTINVEQPHPAGNFGEAPLYLNTRTRPWLQPAGAPRRAGVSSFGFGGTNYHVVLEEHEPELDSPYRMHARPRPLLLSAPTPADLAERCDRRASELTHGDAFDRAAGGSERVILPAAEARVGLVASSAEEACALLLQAAERLRREPDATTWDLPAGISYRRSALAGARVAALFPGQGSQYVGMGGELAANFPEVREAFRRADEQAGEALSTIVFAPPAFESAARDAKEVHLRQTEHAQPAIGAISAGMYAILRRQGLTPDFFGGHSFGELSALWAAGALADDAFARLAASRGRAMAALPADGFDPGAMLSVGAAEGRVGPIVDGLPGVVLANINSPSQVVLAGDTAAIAVARKQIEAAGIAAIPLPVSAAFHSPKVAHAQAEFQLALAGTSFSKPTMPVYANATASPYSTDPDGIASTLHDQILQPVRFQAMVENMYAAGARVFVEIGPRGVLTNLVHDILAGREHVAIAMNPSRTGDSDRQFRLAAVQLAVAGVTLDLSDPYVRAVTPPAIPAGPATVTINGANYISEKTRMAHEQALNNNREAARTAAPAIPAAAVEPTLPAPIPAARGVEQAVAEIGAAVAAAGSVQTEMAGLHQQFLAQQAEQTKMFLDILAKQQDLLRLPHVANLPASVHQSLADGLGQFHQVQAATVQAHISFLQQHGGLAGSAPAALPRLAAPAPVQITPPRVEAPAQPALPPPTASPVQAPAPTRDPAPVVAPATKPAGASPAIDVAGELLAVVSDKTGYPVATLDLGMDVEADLGIDSIKRVEILGAMRELFPDAPALNPTELAELRTLGQIAGYLSRHAGVGEAATEIAPPHPPQAEPAQATDLDPATELLAVVSDKTGYPVQTLDLSMDIEADLGIDSIKRVEILGALRDRFPKAPVLTPADLGELRTLGDVVAYLQGSAGEPISAQHGATLPARAMELADTPVRGIRLKMLVPADRLATVEPGHCLLVEEASPLSAALRDALRNEGYRVSALTLPGVDGQPRETSLRAVDDETIAAGLATIAESGPLAGVIYVHPLPATSDHLFAEEEAEVLTAPFFLAKHLRRYLTSDESARPFFVTISRLDGALGLGLNGHDQLGQSAIAGGLFGLVKTLRLEWPGVFCRAIDLDPACDPDVAASRVLEELLDPDLTLAEVGLSADRRVTVVPEDIEALTLAR